MKRSAWHRFVLGAACLLLATGMLAGCKPGGDGDGSGSDAADEEAKEPEAAPVEVAELARGDIEAVLSFTADLEAEREVKVFSEAARQVETLHVEEGDAVRAGQLLASLEDDAQRSAIAMVKSQLDQARRDHERQKSLFERELISEEAFNTATYELEQLEIALEDAQRELSYTEVRAPIAGTVTARLIRVGDSITVNQHLFDIVDFDSLVVRVYVPERGLHRVEVGQQARLTSQAVPDTVFAAEVDRVAPVVDSRTGTVKTTLTVPYRPGLLPGMFLDVNLVTDVKDDALLVPKRALVLDDDQTFVFRVTDEETVERLLIEPALEDASFVEVREELAVGDLVVTAGQAGPKPGDEVRVVGRSSPAGDADAGGVEVAEGGAGAEGAEAEGAEPAADSTDGAEGDAEPEADV